MSYRQSRNIEASLIEKIKLDLVSANWANVRVVKSFTQVYEGDLPCICVNVSEVRPEVKEIGNYTSLKYYLTNVRIFTTNDGQRLDMSDWLLEKLEEDYDYYVYTIVNGAVISKIKLGRISISKITSKKELTNTETVAVEDRYRHLFNFECRIAQED